MGALRWSLAELRRRTGLTDAFRGNPISCRTREDVDVVDVMQTASGVILDDIPEGDFLKGSRSRRRPASRLGY